jgi:hypothetical protein
VTMPPMPGYPTGPVPVYPQGQPIPAGQYYGQPAPLPQGIQPQPGWGGQGQGQGYPQQQPQPQQPRLEDQRIPAGDPNWPQELWGRSIGEARRYYGIMRQDFINRRQAEAQQQPLQGQPQGQQQPWQQPQQQQQPNPFQPPQQQGQQPQQNDPIQRAVQEAVNRALPQALAPTQAGMAEVTRDRVAAQYPDWAHYAGEIHRALEGFPPQQLALAETWENAYDLARGAAWRRAQRGLPPAGQQPQQPQPQGGWQQPAPQFQAGNPGGPYAGAGQGGYPGGSGPVQHGSQPGYGQPAYPVQQPFYQNPAPQAPPPPAAWGFTESPTPAAPIPGQAPADPRDEEAAKRFGLPVELYRMAKQNPDAAAQWSIANRGGRPGQMAPQAPGYGPAGYQPQAQPGYPPMMPQTPQGPTYFGPPQAYAGMATPNGGYYGSNGRTY